MLVVYYPVMFVSQVHSIRLTEAGLTVALSQLSQYIDRYRRRFKDSNRLLLLELEDLLHRLLRCVSPVAAGHFEEEKRVRLDALRNSSPGSANHPSAAPLGPSLSLTSVKSRFA